MNKKSEWMAMPEEYFETLAFGELQVGQKFIVLPCPGDNHGHGGFKRSYSLFIKTDMHVAEVRPGMPYGVPMGRAICIKMAIPIDFPDTMSVIFVE